MHRGRKMELRKDLVSSGVGVGEVPLKSFFFLRRASHLLVEAGAIAARANARRGPTNNSTANVNNWNGRSEVHPSPQSQQGHFVTLLAHNF